MEPHSLEGGGGGKDRGVEGIDVDTFCRVTEIKRKNALSFHNIGFTGNKFIKLSSVNRTITSLSQR